MRRCIIIFALFLSIQGILAQQKSTDSLLKSLPSAREDTNKIKLLLALVSEYVQNDTDSAAYFLDESKILLTKLDANQLFFDYYYAGIKLYHATQDFEKALDYNLKALESAEKYKNLSNKADALRALFTVYINLKKDSLAIQVAHQALKLTEKLKDTINLPITFGNLSRLYYELGQYEKAIEYGLKGIDAGKKYNSLKGLLVSLNNTAASNVELGRAKEGEKLYKEQLALAYRNNIPRSVVKALINLSFVAIDEGDSKQLNQYTKELNEFIASNPKAPIAPSDLKYVPLFNGYNHLFYNRYEAAEQEALEGLKNAKNDDQLLLQLYNLLIKISYTKYDFKKAEWYEEKSDSIEGVLLKDDLAGYEIEAAKKYETEKKEAQLELQKASIRQKSILNYILIGSAAALLSIIILSYRNYQNRQKLQQQRITELETQQQLTATEAILKGESQERTRLAKDLHDGLGGMLSGIKYSLNTMKGNLIMTPENAQAFERSVDMLDSSIQEMRRVAHNMMPEALVKFGLDTALQDFCLHISQSGALKVSYQSIGLNDVQLEQTVAVTIYRIVQELINNTIKHAAAKTAIVQLSVTGNTLSVTVEDDGKGLDTASLKQSTGIGWSNIENRILFLNGKLDIQSANNKGTSVLIELPLT
ncbi:tetratricopeptide repeat-containing sensor histidine kinase [Niabella yanshanensis]|uniref:tetratricopeptide repeat-containing sensor histidine kinase n=1 Tax=Niabella yanshanensis TaxID=577386 RepID=UPI000E0ACC57|nr:sensor histidine kinase [Niabella yanshanensis]